MDEMCGFPLPSSQTIVGKQLIQGHYAVGWYSCIKEAVEASLKCVGDALIFLLMS